MNTDTRIRREAEAEQKRLRENFLRTTKERAMALTDLIAVLRKELDRVSRHCCNCTHFDEPNATCKMFKAKPPARIIATGCPQHVNDDEIPF